MHPSVTRLSQLKSAFIFATICQIYASIVAYVVLLLQGEVSSGRERAHNAQAVFLAIDVVGFIIGALNILSAQATIELRVKTQDAKVPKQWPSTALPMDATLLGGCLCFDALARICFEGAWTPAFALLKLSILLRACYMQGIYSNFRFMRVHLHPHRPDDGEAAHGHGSAVTNRLLMPLTGRAHAQSEKLAHQPDTNRRRVPVFCERARIFLLHVLSSGVPKVCTRQNHRSVLSSVPLPNQTFAASGRGRWRGAARRGATRLSRRPHLRPALAIS